MTKFRKWPRPGSRLGRILGLTALLMTAGTSLPVMHGQPGANAGRGKPALKVVAYYFHVSARCVTCRTIESYSKEAVERGYAKEIEEGRVEWRPVNVQLPQNRHYIRDYQLYTRSLVLVKYREGKQVEWRNLDRVWQLVRRKGDFLKYVQSNLAAYLGEG
jgi:hypothetical protein